MLEIVRAHVVVVGGGELPADDSHNLGGRKFLLLYNGTKSQFHYSDGLALTALSLLVASTVGDLAVSLAEFYPQNTTRTVEIRWNFLRENLTGSVKG